MANANTQLTTSAALSESIQTFYDRKLLDAAETQLVHAKFGQMRGIPKNGGKTIDMRRVELFDPSNTLLQEGVTPDGQNIEVSNVTAAISQFGAYVTISDLLDLTSIDPLAREAVKRLGDQLGRAVEWKTRDAMNATTNVQWAGGNTSRFAIDTDLLTVAEIRKAVRTLKKNKAPKFSVSGKRPHYVCICSPDATFDLQTDQLWQDVSKYSNAEQIYNGELGRLFDVVFVESTEAKVYRQSVLNAVNANTTTSADFVLKNDPTEAEVAFLSKAGNKITVDSTEYTIASYTPATKTVTLSAAASLTADKIVYSKDAGAVDATSKKGVDIHSTLVFGADAYGVIDIAGSGAVQTIIKPAGSAGSADPLNQRSTVGAKVMAYAAVILNDLWIVSIEHAVTA